jgi:hypothetical protein
VTTPEGPGLESGGSPEPDVIAPAPIVPLGINEPADTGHRDEEASLLPGGSASMSDSDGEQQDSRFWRREVSFFGVSTSPKRWLTLLSGILGFEAALAVTIIVSTFVVLVHDHGVAVGQAPPIASLNQNVILLTGRLTVFIGAMVAFTVVSATGAWGTFRGSRAPVNEVSRTSRYLMTVGVAAQPVAFVVCLIMFGSGRGTAENSPVSPFIWPLPEWESLILVALGALTAFATLLGVQSFRLRLLRPVWTVLVLTMAVTGIVAFFGTNAVASSFPVSVGFWKFGPQVQTGLLDRVDGLSCPMTGDCVVVAAAVDYWSIGTTSGGRIVATSKRTFESPYPGHISCPTQVVCLAPGFVPMRSTNGGKTFIPMVIAAGSHDIELRCDSPTRCYAFAPSLFEMSTDEGLHWKTLLTIQTGPGAKTILSGACPTVTDCFVLGYADSSPYALYTITGGRTWSSASGVPDSYQLSNARCVTVTTCYALALNTERQVLVIKTIDAGKSWSRVSAIAGIETFGGFACPEERLCIVTGSERSGTGTNTPIAEVSTNDAETWRTTMVMPSHTLLASVACGGDGLCAVGVSYARVDKGAAVEVSTNYGQSWNLVPFPRVTVPK